MHYKPPFSTCSRTSNTCPSKRNCYRHEKARSEECTDAALNVRREAGANACDMWIPITKPATTFVDPLEWSRSAGVEEY